MDSGGRRALFTGLLAGGTVIAGAAPAAAATWTPRYLSIGSVRTGDMVVGPGGAVVRVAGLKRSGSRYLLAYNDPHTAAVKRMNPPGRTDGYPSTQRLAVLARGIPLSAIPKTTPPAAPDPAPAGTIDGGTP